MSEFLSSPEEQVKEYSRRYKLLYMAIIGLGILFFCRLWYLQIIEGKELRIFSERNRIKETRIPAPRGIIYDRNHKILVENLPGFEVTLQPQYVGNLKRTAEAVGAVIGIPAAQIISMVHRSQRMNGPFRPVKIKDNLTRDEVFWLKLLRWDYSGLDISETEVRTYPLKDDGAQLFGYVGEISRQQLPILNAEHRRHKLEEGDIIGKSGLEAEYDSILRGQEGVSVTQVDAKGRAVSFHAPSFLGNLGRTREPKPGDAMVLTLDRDIQKAANKAFLSTGLPGGVVAMKPDGEIIAWVSTPSFDPNWFSVGITDKQLEELITDPARPFYDKVIQDRNPPGSTFKPIVALAALQEGLITPQSTFYCPGHLKFGHRIYHCDLKTGHGHVNVVQAIEASCDVFFYHLGIGLGIDRIAKYAKSFGLGHRTGIAIPDEVPGLIPTTAWKKKTFGEEWMPGENLSSAIGQGYILATPLQMATVFAAISSDGKLYRPYVVKQILNLRGKVIKSFKPHLVRDLTDPDPKGGVHIDRKNFEIVKEGLRLVANGPHGTAHFWKIKGLEFAGKTGTAQVRSWSASQIYTPCEDRPPMYRNDAWFVGYAPPEHPKIIVAVMAEHACWGATAGVPTTVAVIQAYMKKYYPQLFHLPKNQESKPVPSHKASNG